MLSERSRVFQTAFKHFRICCFRPRDRPVAADGQGGGAQRVGEPRRPRAGQEA